MFNRFNINAAHSKLLPYSKVKVLLYKKFVTVTINDLPQNPDDMVLYLSKEAADELGITEDGITVPCNIEILNEDILESYIICFLIFSPIFILTFIAWLNNFN